MLKQLPREEWVKINGFENYQVSSMGRVRKLWSKAQPLILKLHHDKDGYLRAVLFLHGKRHQKRVHHLVFDHFCGTRAVGLVVCHNDGNRENNSYENLRLDTQMSNIRDKFLHGTVARGEKIGCSKLTACDVLKIREMGRIRNKNSIYSNTKELSSRFGVSTVLVRKIIKNEVWRHV